MEGKCGKIQKELEILIRTGKKTGDMKLKNMAREALFGLLADDGTAGLSEYLWEMQILPNLIEARKRAAYIQRTKNVNNTANMLAKRRDKV